MPEYRLSHLIPQLFFFSSFSFSRAVACILDSSKRSSEIPKYDVVCTTGLSRCVEINLVRNSIDQVGTQLFSPTHYHQIHSKQKLQRIHTLGNRFPSTPYNAVNSKAKGSRKRSHRQQNVRKRSISLSPRSMNLGKMGSPVFCQSHAAPQVHDIE